MPNKEKINIQLIIKGCRRNNRNSQEMLFKLFAGYGLNICLRYTNSQEEAEEILNNGFLKVFNNIDQYDMQLPFRPWLQKILVNASIDYYRANKNKMRFLELRPDLTEDTAIGPLPMIASDEDMLPVLQQLPPAYKMVFNLYVMEGYNHEEIAEQLGISASTSRSNLARAKTKLKEIILKKKALKSITS